MIAGVLTGPGPGTELDLLRTRPQRTKLYLAIPEYHIAHTAQVDGTLASNDNVTSVHFKNGLGDLGKVLPGMTLLIGSSHGAWDIGMARIRADSLDTGGGAGYFLIGIMSEIEWIDNLYLTVIDDFGLWPRHPRIDAAGELFMDYDIDYVEQNAYGAPIIIMGSHAVAELVAGTTTVSFDATDTYVAIGVPGSYTYLWSCVGPTIGDTVVPVIPGLGLANFTFTQAGTYTIYLTVTAIYGGGAHTAQSKAVRYIIVYDDVHPLNKSFTLESCEGDYEAGGWAYRVTMNANADDHVYSFNPTLSFNIEAPDIRDRTLCLLVAKDWYDTTQQSIGPLTGRENIVCVGWADGESITRSNDRSTVSFDIQGPTYWLDVQEGFPTGVDDLIGPSADWSHIQQLTPAKGLFSFLHWRSTATAVMDCWLSDDDHRLATTYTPAGSLLEQLRSIAERINAKAVSDRYGRLFAEIDTQFITPVLRLFPVVQILTDRDWRDEITIERREVAEAGQVDLSGVHYSGVIPLDATTYSVFSLSPGHYPKHYGSKYKVERIALDNQAEADLLAGLWLGYLNNEYPHIDTPMSSNYRAVDIAPRMFVRMNLAAMDTPREIVWSNKKLIPRQVSFNYDGREALLLTDITFEAETFPGLAITGDPPITPPDGKKDPPTPPLLCNDPLALNFGGPAPCIYRIPTDIVVVMNAAQLARSLDFYGALPPTWGDLKTGALAGANVGAFLNIALNSATGQCWVLTYKDEPTIGDNGIWYCADMAAAAPTFSLVQTITAYRALTAGGGYPSALGCDDAGTAYASGPYPGGAGRYMYGTDTFALSNAMILPNGYQQFAVASGTTPVIAGGAGGVPAFGVFSMAGAVSATLYYNLGPQPDPACVARNHFIWPAVADDLYSFVDGNGAALVYNDADHAHPIISDGVNILTVRVADGFLMNGAAPLADPAVAFGAARGGAGYCFGLAGYGEIIWIATDVGATDHFIAMRDTGGAWTDKTGDFNTAIGAWAGASVIAMPIPVTCSI